LTPRRRQRVRSGSPTSVCAGQAGYGTSSDRSEHRGTGTNGGQNCGQEPPLQPATTRSRAQRRGRVRAPSPKGRGGVHNPPADQPASPAPRDWLRSRTGTGHAPLAPRLPTRRPRRRHRRPDAGTNAQTMEFHGGASAPECPALCTAPLLNHSLPSGALSGGIPPAEPAGAPVFLQRASSVGQAAVGMHSPPINDGGSANSRNGFAGHAAGVPRPAVTHCRAGWGTTRAARSQAKGFPRRDNLRFDLGTVGGRWSGLKRRSSRRCSAHLRPTSGVLDA
jgi:hypothetical protein